jgi:hypothetical protein
MRQIGPFAGLMAVVALALPAWAQAGPPRLVIEVSEQNPAVEQPVDITVRVYDPDEPSRLVDPADPDSLIEIRTVSGSEVPTRPAMTRQSEGVYTTTFSFFTEGTWKVVALPDLADRSLLPPASTDQLTVQVSNEVSRGDAESDPAGTIALIALIAGGLAVAILAGPWLRRPKGRPPAPPVYH